MLGAVPHRFFPAKGLEWRRSWGMDREGLSLQARFEVSKKYAAAYEAASKKDKGLILDQVVAVTGWNRDHARQQLRARLHQPKGRATATIAVLDRRRTKPCRYSYDARKVLQTVWAASGGLCGKYLTAPMADWPDQTETEDSLDAGQDRYTKQVHAELIAMSAATIDPYLAPVKAKDPIPGKTTTKPGSLLRNSIIIRKTGDEVEAEPGFFEVDTLAHCDTTLKGEFCRSVNFTDVHTGWVFTRSIRNNAHIHILSAFNAFHHPHPLHGHRHRLRQRQRVHQPSPHRLGHPPNSVLHPFPPLQKQRPRHHRTEKQPPRTPLRHTGRTRPTQPALGPGT